MGWWSMVGVDEDIATVRVKGATGSGSHGQQAGLGCNCKVQQPSTCMRPLEGQRCSVCGSGQGGAVAMVI
jgi:hypothetical protein